MIKWARGKEGEDFVEGKKIEVKVEVEVKGEGEGRGTRERQGDGGREEYRSIRTLRRVRTGRSSIHNK